MALSVSSLVDVAGGGQVGTGTCPVTGKHVRIWEEYVSHETSYVTGGTSIMPQLAEAGIKTPTAIAIGTATGFGTTPNYTLYNDGGTWKLKAFEATGQADDTAAEAPAATNFALASVRLRIYGLP